MSAFPEGSVSEDPASPSVLHEAKEREEFALLTWMTSQGSPGSPSRLARVSTRTSMRLKAAGVSSDCAATTLRKGAITINNEVVADFTGRRRAEQRETALRCVPAGRPIDLEVLQESG